MTGEYNFDKKQSELLYSDDFICKLCGSNRQLERHHIRHKNRNAKSIFNSILICQDCHKRFGSSSADDTAEHLNISAKYIIQKIIRLEMKHMYFSRKKFLTKIDKDFILDNKNFYKKDIYENLLNLGK